MLVATYPPLLVGAIWFHQQRGPVEEGSASLLLALGLGAALVGLASILMALVALSWTRRLAVVTVAIAVVVGLWTPGSTVAGFLIWQLLVMFVAQIGVLIAVLGMTGVRGWSLGFDPTRLETTEPSRSRGRTQLAIPDVLLLIGALGIFFGVLRSLSPTQAIPLVIYHLLGAGGAGAAVVALVVLWATFGRAPVVLRLAAAALVAPLGGLVFLWARRQPLPGGQLLFDTSFYAGVTTAQVVLMALPALALRWGTLRFRRADRESGWFRP